MFFFLWRARNVTHSSSTRKSEEFRCAHGRVEPAIHSTPSRWRWLKHRIWLLFNGYVTAEETTNAFERIACERGEVVETHKCSPWIDHQTVFTYIRTYVGDAPYLLLLLLFSSPPPSPTALHMASSSTYILFIHTLHSKYSLRIQTNRVATLKGLFTSASALNLYRCAQFFCCCCCRLKCVRLDVDAFESSFCVFFSFRCALMNFEENTRKIWEINEQKIIIKPCKQKIDKFNVPFVSFSVWEETEFLFEIGWLW